MINIALGVIIAIRSPFGLSALFPVDRARKFFVHESNGVKN